MKWKKKENIFGIAVGVILVIIIFSLAVITTDSTRQQPPTQNISVTSSPTLVLDPPRDTVISDLAAEKKLIDKLINRVPLSPDDSSSKARILALLPPGKKSGTIQQTPNMLIEYIEPVDEFQVQILTADIAKAKSEANIWFRSRGMSQKGICDLPLNFYLSVDVANFLRANKIVFSVLANGC